MKGIQKKSDHSIDRVERLLEVTLEKDPQQLTVSS